MTNFSFCFFFYLRDYEHSSVLQYYMVEEFVLYFEMKICLKIVDQPLLKLYYFINNIVSGSNRVLNGEHRLSPSNLRYWVPRCNGIKLKHSFVHPSVLKLNMKLPPVSDLH